MIAINLIKNLQLNFISVWYFREFMHLCLRTWYHQTFTIYN